MKSGERLENLSYLVPRDPSIKCWSDRVKLSAPWTKNLMDEIEKELADDKLKVYLRLKPSTGIGKFYNVINSTTLETEAPKESVSYKNVANGVGKLVHKFTFTSILNEASSQTFIFERCVLANLKRFLSGENYLLMAYGTTSAGKTFTMQGTIEHPGIIPRAMGFVFNSLREKIEPSYRYQPYRSSEFVLLSEEQMKKEMNHKNFILTLDLTKYQRHPETLYMTYKNETTIATASSSGFSEGYENSTFREMQDRLSNMETYEVSSHRYCVWISMVEIYNEQVYDLLEVPDEKGGRMKLGYGEDENGNIYIKNLRYVNVGSGHEAFQVLQFGRTNLHLAPTALNNSSSRSHCICTITIARFLDDENAVISRFSFCDLAGMERAKKTLNVGDRLAESKSINTSLLILVKCLTTIKENQGSKDKKMIPFRESKLTRLFKDAMTGKEKFSMIVNVTTEPNLFDETLNVLKFSAIAQQIVPKNVFVKPRRILPAGKSRFSRLVAKSRESSKMIDWDTSTVVDEESKLQSNQAYQDLLNLVDELKNNLAEEKLKCERIEIEIREELTTKFSEMLKQQRERNEARIETATSRLQEQFERKEKRLLDYCKKLDKQAKKRKLEEHEEIDVEHDEILREKEENLKAMEKQLEFLTAENGSLREQLLTLSNDNSSLQAKVTKVTFELTEKNRVLEQLEKQSKASGDGTSALVKELQEQLQEKALKNLEFKELLNNAAAEHKELLENCQFLKEENDSLEKDLAEKSEMIEDMKLEIIGLQESLTEKREALEEMENREFAAIEESKKIQEKIEEISKLREDEANEKNSEIDALQKEVKRLNLKIQEAVAEAKLPIEELTAANEKLLNEVEDLKTGKLVLEKNLENLKIEKLELEKIFEELKIEKLELDKNLEELKIGQLDLEKNLEELKIEKSELNKNLEKLKIGKLDLEKNLEELKIEKLELEKQSEERVPIEELTEANEKLEKEVEKLIKEKLTLERKLEDQAGTAELVLANEKLKGEVENCKKEKCELEKKLEGLEKDAQFNKRNFETEIAGLTRKMEALEYQSEVMKKMKDEAEKSAYEAREEIELLKNEIDNKTQELKSFTDNRQQMFSNYEKEITRLKEENERIRKDLKFNNEVIMKNITPLKADQAEIQKLKNSLKKKDEEISKLKAITKSPPKIEITAVQCNNYLPDNDIIESSSSRENSPFKDLGKKKKNVKKESTPERLAKQIEQLSITQASSTVKKSKKKVDQLEESIHPCNVKGTGRNGRKGGKKEKKEKEEKEEVAPVKKDNKCNKKLFTENDFDNLGNLEASFVEPEVPLRQLRPRKN